MSRSRLLGRKSPIAISMLLLVLAIQASCQASVTPTPTADPVARGRIGQEIKIDRHRVTVDRLVKVDFLTYEERTAAAQGQYVIVLLTVANDSNRGEVLSYQDFLLRDASGQYYAAATSHHLVTGFNPTLAAASVLEVQPFTREVAGLSSVHTALAFDIPREAVPESLSLFGGRGLVSLSSGQ